MTDLSVSSVLRSPPASHGCGRAVPTLAAITVWATVGHAG